MVSCFKKMRIKNNINFTRQKIYFNYRMSKNITSKNITGVNNNLPFYNELRRSRANTPVYPEKTKPNSNKFRRAAATLESLFKFNTPVPSINNPSINNQSVKEPAGGKHKRAHHNRTRRNKRKGTRRNKRRGTRRNKRN